MSSLGTAVEFPRAAAQHRQSFPHSRLLLGLTVSIALLIPCFWHQRIEASDLASHTYNAWLASLIAKGQAPGLYAVKQWTNVAVDAPLAWLGARIGFLAAEKIVTSACVLIFFWGAFAFISVYSGRAPWMLAPGIAMIAYGWTFYMGFLNYYLSVGLAFLAIALFKRGRAADWVLGIVLAAGVLLAHPMGFVWLIVVGAYLWLADRLTGVWRWLPFGAACLGIVAFHYYVIRFRTEYWDTSYFYLLNGANQLVLFGKSYWLVAGAVFVFGIFCFVYGLISERGNASRWNLRTALELWALLLICAALAPETVWLPTFPAPLGMIIVRLTTITAVMGVCILSCVPPRAWQFAGFALCAAAYFVLMYRDTGVLNRMEQQAQDLTRTLPYGRRVIETVWQPPNSAIYFINHLVDRACIGHCLAYANYEASSRQFRIRAQAGNPFVTADSEASGRMETGDYVVKSTDLPMTQIYQCDEKDWTKLCMRDLQAGERNGRIGYRPPDE